MPGKSVDDFEVGQWVGIAFKDGHYREVGRISKIDKSAIHSGEPKFWIVDKYGVTIGKFGKPSSLFTPDETEEQLYHCSYCGTEGHNRRTCPKLVGITEEVKMEYTKGDRIDPKTLVKNDLFAVKDTLKDSAKWDRGVYEVEESHPGDHVRGKVVETNGEDIGPFGKDWSFNVSRWEFYAVTSNKPGEIPGLKTLTVWELIEKVLPASRLTLLYGPPGTGKTTAGNFLGEPQEVYNLTLTEETPAAELRGHFIPKGNEFVWMDGPALTAFKKGARLVLNEIDKASGDALTFCHALLDDPGIAKITLPYKDDSGETVSVKPHEDFHVVATMNGEPEDLPEALRDRFAVRIEVDQVHPNAIKSLPLDLQKIASKGVSKDGERSVSIRGWNAFVQLREMVGEENAARAVFGSRAATILNTIKIDGLSTGKE